jgi:ABC-type multidrug transport system fused ATPase/permease subunit
VIARSNATITTLGDLPKFAMETLAFCALLCLAIYLLMYRDSSAAVVSILSLYSVAGYKLLPAAQTIFKSIADIRANRSVLDDLYPAALEGRQLIELTAQIATGPTVTLGEIRFNDISYGYPEASTLALRDINLTIKLNTIVAFVGLSGAGKSTLADVLLGLLTPTSGTLTVGGTIIESANMRAWQRHLGYVPQNIFLIDDTICANVVFGAAETAPDISRVESALELANLDALVSTLEEGTNFIVGERGTRLSGGQRQRIGIARALYHNTDVLVMDEATSALDNVTEQEVIQTIMQLKSSKTIIMIAHRLSTIRHADQIVFMDGGAICAIGTFDELCARNPEFRRMTLHSAAQMQEQSEQGG